MSEEAGPDREDEVPPAPDATLGGYLREHSRPPAFEGRDGEAYTVSLEAEKTPDLRAPYQAYLVFPRWARGYGIVGHVETATLASGRSREDALEALGELPLRTVKALLDEAIERAAGREPPGDPSPS